VRRLVYNLRPPALDELGLMSALRERATAFPTDQGTQVIVEGPEHLSPLPAAVEVAAYRVAQEAVKNAAHHGKAEHCWVRLRVQDGLTLEVVDDGCGISRDVQAGVGITSMKERAAELGGSFRVEPLPSGGTSVVVWLPIAEKGV
jgi:signal transduction histidine kinase